MKDVYENARKFINEFGLYQKNYFWKFSNPAHDSVMIDIADQEVFTFSRSESKIGQNNFNGEKAKSVNVANWPTTPENENEIKFFGKYFPIVDSTWDKVVIKISDNLYATTVKDMIYEWDDLK